MGFSPGTPLADALEARRPGNGASGRRAVPRTPCPRKQLRGVKSASPPRTDSKPRNNAVSVGVRISRPPLYTLYINGLRTAPGARLPQVVSRCGTGSRGRTRLGRIGAAKFLGTARPPDAGIPPASGRGGLAAPVAGATRAFPGKGAGIDASWPRAGHREMAPDLPAGERPAAPGGAIRTRVRAPVRAAGAARPHPQLQKSTPSRKNRRESTILWTSEAPSTRRAWRA